MSTETAPKSGTTGTEESDLDHVFCGCNPDVALCGIDLSNADYVEGQWSEDDGDFCVVCLDLCDVPCPTCGNL